VQVRLAAPLKGLCELPSFYIRQAPALCSLDRQEGSSGTVCHGASSAAVCVDMQRTDRPVRCLDLCLCPGVGGRRALLFTPYRAPSTTAVPPMQQQCAWLMALCSCTPSQPLLKGRRY